MGCAGQYVTLFRREMVAVINQVRRRSGFHGLALDDRVLQYVLEVVEQRLSHCGQHAMLVEEHQDRGTQLGRALDEARERRVLARVMKTVGVVVEVVHDVAHQFIVGVAAFVEFGHLLLEKIEQAREAHVFCMPNSDRVGHDGPPWNKAHGAPDRFYCRPAGGPGLDQDQGPCRKGPVQIARSRAG